MAVLFVAGLTVVSAVPTAFAAEIGPAPSETFDTPALRDDHCAEKPFLDEVVCRLLGDHGDCADEPFVQELVCRILEDALETEVIR